MIPKFHTPRGPSIAYAPPSRNLNHLYDLYSGPQTYRVIMKDKVIPSAERFRQKKLKSHIRQQMFSFNNPGDGAFENKEYLLKELLKRYPHGDLTKTKQERDFRTNTPTQGRPLQKQEFRRDDMFTKVKGVPRNPFIPSHIPKLSDTHSENEVKVETKQSDIEERGQAGEG